MEAALGGAALGIIGLLGGAVLALWWKAKANKAQGRAVLLAQRLVTEEEAHDETLRSAQAAAEKYQSTGLRKDEVLDDLQKRYDALLSRSVENADHHELLDMANRPPSVRLVHEDSDGHEVANEDGDGS